jgi:hypothetical protein
MEKSFDFSLQNGSSMLVSGPTMCGKSTFVHALLKDKLMFSTPPDRVYWFYGQATNDLNGKDYILKEGLPETFADIEPNSVIVLDDLMQEAKDHPGVTNLFTKLVHHNNLFVINITQNFFLRTNETRTRRLNSQYLVLFKNPSDATQIAVIGRQMFPQNPNFLSHAYSRATKRPHGYIFIDLRQETEDDLRIRSRVLEFPMHVYKQGTKHRIINKHGQREALF